MADMIDYFISNARRFGFFQAVRLCEEYVRKKYGEKDPVESGRIRFSPDSSTDFPSSDISGAKPHSDTINMTLSFMSLTGVSSPLPNYFSDYIARYPDKSSALADLCAIFNNRMYALFYKAFWKYRLISSIEKPAVQRWISCLSGGLKIAGENSRVFAYSGIMSDRRRNADGCAAILSDYFGGIPVSIRQWTPRRISVPSPACLDGRSRLGKNAMAGTEMTDISGSFRVVIGPLSREKFEMFLEGTKTVETVRTIVSLYTADPLAFDIEIILSAEDIVPLILGDESARLGRTVSLGKNRAGMACREYSVVLEGMA